MLYYFLVLVPDQWVNVNILTPFLRSHLALERGDSMLYFFYNKLVVVPSKLLSARRRTPYPRPNIGAQGGGSMLLFVQLLDAGASLVVW